MSPSNPLVCIIGAGVSGLCAARYLKEEGISFKVLEATNYVGGTWRYDSRVGADENGLPIHTSMYQNLRTNLAAPAMELRGFPIPPDMPAFPSWRQYYEYIVSYARYFDLEKYIQFHQLVTSVKRIGSKWTIQHRDVQSEAISEDVYDYIVVANGHFSKTSWPDIPGEERFTGTIIHSHDYRVPDTYKDSRVLIIGKGPSAMDIGVDVAAVCKTLLHSHHAVSKLLSPYPPHYIFKPDVKEYTEKGVIFVDGTVEAVDYVIYCTGYEYNFSFLDETSELTIAPKYILPLHKSIVNINHPSMMFLGVINCACNVIAIDAQARYVTAVVAGKFSLPTKKDMMEELHNFINIIQTEHRSLRDIHYIGKTEDEYYQELTKESGIDRVPPVMAKIRMFDNEKKLENYYTYRNFIYTITDNETFTRHIDPLSDSKDQNT